ncbi:MAG: DedA family protein [Anaerolineae bacterium]|nr:MAG: DedA family protein [Anaerolineae bacterium]
MNRSPRTLAILRLTALLIVITLTWLIYQLRDRAAHLAVYGYPGIFLIALLSNATIILPAPGVTLVFAMGGVFNPFLVGLAAGAGGALGELSGYLAGFSGQAVVPEGHTYQRLSAWVQRYGMLAVFLLAALPNPVFDLAGLAAGILRMPLPRFLLAVWGGVTLKMIVFAWAGAHSIDWILGH